MLNTVKIFTQFKHNEDLPRYETSGSAGMDIRANETVVLRPGEIALIPTGIFMEIPEGYEIQVRPRSGYSLKTPIRIANSPGTIDSDYRNELKIIAENTSYSDEFKIPLGERIAQIVLQKVPRIYWEQVPSLEYFSKTNRSGGFGSTGK